MVRRMGLITMLLALLGGRHAHASPPTVFEPGRVWTVHIQLSADAWQTMQPTRGSRLAFLLELARSELPTTRPAEYRGPTDRNAEGFRLPPVAAGLEYAYVKATVNFDGQTFRDVGLRFKGNGSYLSSAWLRRPMKLNFDKFVEGQKFRDAAELNLHMSAVDPSLLREPLGYEVYRDAGVPAPRVAFAMVFLSVEGLYDRQYLGLYDLVEDIADDFLNRHFGTAKGLLLKPDGVRNLAYLGEDWAEYWRYRPKEEGSPRLRQRFIDFVRLVHHADDETFVGAISSYLDVDRFLRFLAAVTLLSDMDSFLTAGHNFYLYVHPRNLRVHFIPWDMHLAFGGTASDQAPQRAVNLSIAKPFPGSNRLIERVLMIDGYRRAYEQYLGEFARGHFSPQRMHPRIDQLQSVVRLADDIVHREVRLGGATTRPATMPARPLRPMPELKTFVSLRTESVLGQLAGTVEGWAPGDPAPAPPPPPPPPPRMINPAPPRIATRAEARAARAEAQRANRARPVVNRPRLDPPAARRPNRGGLTGASLVLRAIDTDRTSSLTVSEITDAVRVFYHATGGAAEGLDHGAVASGLDRMGYLLDTARVVPLESEESTSQAALEWAGAILKLADANRDGRASLHEAIEALRNWFIMADVNGDGLLISREIAEAMDSMIAP